MDPVGGGCDRMAAPCPYRWAEKMLYFIINCNKDIDTFPTKGLRGLYYWTGPWPLEAEVGGLCTASFTFTSPQGPAPVPGLITNLDCHVTMSPT